MPVKPIEILHVATTLLNNNAEAARRTAVSRAYYAAYHHGIQVVDIKLPLTKNMICKGGCHQQLFMKLSNGQSRIWEDIAFKVNALRRERVRADYYLDQPISKGLANECVRTAQQIIDALDSV